MAKLQAVAAVYRCEACSAEAMAVLGLYSAQRNAEIVVRPQPSQATLWRAGWTALAGWYTEHAPSGHVWICPACAATRQESRVLVALRGVRLVDRWPWWMPVRYHVEHALWALRRTWRRAWFE